MTLHPVASIKIMCNETNDTDYFLLLVHCLKISMQCYHDEPMYLQNSY